MLLFQSFLGGLFGPICEIDVVLNDAESRKTAEIKTEDGKIEKHYLFYDGESVSGKVSSFPPPRPPISFIQPNSQESILGGLGAGLFLSF